MLYSTACVSTWKKSESEFRTPKRQPCLGREPIEMLEIMNKFWTKIRYVVQNFTNSTISIIQWSASVATSFQSPQCFILEKSRKNLLLDVPRVLFQKVANTAFDVPNVPEGDSWCSKQISIVAKHKCEWVKPVNQWRIGPGSPFKAQAFVQLLQSNIARLSSGR